MNHTRSGILAKKYDCLDKPSRNDYWNRLVIVMRYAYKQSVKNRAAELLSCCATAGGIHLVNNEVKIFLFRDYNNARKRQLRYREVH